MSPHASSPGEPLQAEAPEHVSDYDYLLPPDLIAQHPAKRRDESRLMRVNRVSGDIAHGRFPDICDWLRAGDLLVLNDTRVIPARLIGRKESGGEVEVFLSRPLADGTWEAMARLASGRPRPGLAVHLADGLIRFIRPLDDGLWQVGLETGLPVYEWLEQVGNVPLPPYIARENTEENTPQDRERYQTVYAQNSGAVAAPTAGLHFTPEILSRLEEKGVRRACVTLHVGLGTFRPVSVERVDEVRLHTERYTLPAGTIEAIERTRMAGGRVVAVGTTSVRTLESAAQTGRWEPHEGETCLFLRPGSRFHVVDALITNFHLPRSSLLMLVAAFAGKALIERAYQEAIARQYRFFSYGDAMVIE